MNTAQTVLTQGAQTAQSAQRASVVPWLIGGIVAVALLIVVLKL